MKRIKTIVIGVIGLVASHAAAQTDSTFTYQGELKDGGVLANGPYNMDFSLWDAVSAGNQVGGFLMIDNVAVADGRFAVQLDFGAAAFDNSDRFLEIEVQGQTLSPRQPILRTPYAMQTRGMFVDEIHNVGIGTTLPAAELHVDGHIALGGAQADMRIREVSPGDPEGWAGLINLFGIGIGSDTGTNRQIMMLTDGFVGQPIFTIADSTNAGATWHPDLVVTQGGKVGIGTSTPQDTLHVVGNRIRLEDFAGVKSFMVRADGASVDLQSETSDIFIHSSGTGGNNNIIMQPFGGEGNVGIGTTNPTSLLHVADGVPVLTIQDINSTGDAQAGYVSLRDSSNIERGWMGYGSVSNSDLTVDNSLGDVVLHTNGGSLVLDPFGHVGIGLDPGEHGFRGLHVRGAGESANVPALHLQLLENTSPAGAGILAIKAGGVTEPEEDTHYVTFFNSNNAQMGAITGMTLLGQPVVGVRYTSGASDFAEFLPLLDPDEQIEPGDVVAVRGGCVTRETTGARRVMVVSTAPAFVGNDRGPTDRDEHCLIALVGQVPVRVRGHVNAGDYLVASGLNDGTAIAVAPENLTIDQLPLVAATAWETDHSLGVRPILAGVGIDQAAAAQEFIARLQARQREAESRIEFQSTLIEKLSTRLHALESGADAINGQSQRR